MFDQLPDGRQILGGAPFNVAWNLHRFGNRPIFASAVGDDDLGRSIRSRMLEHSMFDGALTTNDNPTGVVQIAFADGEPSYSIVPDQAYDQTPFQSEIVSAQSISLIYHGSLAWRSEVTRKSIHQYRNVLQDVPVFVDLNIREPWFDVAWLPELIGGINWLKLSLEELAQLVPTCKPDSALGQLEKQNSISAAASHTLQQFSIRHILVTDGSDGAYWITSDQTLYQPAAPVANLADTIGAGDAFSSATIHGLLAGSAPQIALESATKFAAKVCSIAGATTDEISFYDT